ncbi:hypothetical protein [Argonema galeatum]|uniref:hypothetical protein n=1 Tax=Argonema galeatum TaxID=2942762 RepID=UPI0020110304|nr:hypothetical protein [Argonema galeatum]MCL1463529.1 hypothetical protein [Argonema galeatum A003/A1]
MKASLLNYYRDWLPLSIRDRLRPLSHPVKSLIISVILKIANGRVLSGPFKGMKFTLENPDLPKILGTYELEIDSAIKRIEAHRFDLIINVGAGEGYYAVGTALKWPEAVVYAFEADRNKHPQILKLSQNNAVLDRVKILGICQENDLLASLNQDLSTLIIIDIEGSEIELLNPDMIANLKKAVILVELHNFLSEQCSSIIWQRFQASHEIETYTTKDRDLEDFPLKKGIINSLVTKQIIELMCENRPATQEWFLMFPKNCGELYTQKLS